MAIYYVSPYGSDSNNGLGPDPANATNKPFATLGKALASGVTVAGDTVYLAPGVYRGGTTVGVSGSSGSPIAVIGDPGNVRGFKDGSGIPLSAGEVRCTTYTPDDLTVPTPGSVLAMSNRSYLTFSNIWFVAGTPSFASTTSGAIQITAGSHDIGFTACMFSHGLAVSISYNLVVAQNSTTQLPLNLSFDRCIFMSANATHLSVYLNKTAGGADYNAAVSVQNSLFFLGGRHIYVVSGGTGSNYGGGVSAQNCTFLGSYSVSVVTNDSGISTTYPVAVKNSIVLNNTATACLNANTAGQIVEDYNQLAGYRTATVAAGANSTNDGSRCMLLDVGQWMLWGQYPRPFLTPTIGSPQLGYGNASGAPAYDFLNRPRPAGGGSLSSGVGYIERHDTAVKETTVVDAGSAIRFDGPGDHEFQIPVDSTSTTISVKCRYDANHGTATPPQLVLVAAPEIGVASQSVTAPATTDQWLTLTLSAIAPTAKGVIRVRLVARPTAANGKAYFDTFAVS